MKKALIIGWAVGLALLLGGCASVFVTEPVGDRPVAIDRAQWQGTWIGGEVSMMTTVLDSESGRMEVAWLERGDEGAKLERYRGEIRQTGDWLFIDMPNPPPRPKPAGRFDNG